MLSQLLNRAVTGNPLPLAGLPEQETGQIRGIALDGEGQPLANRTIQLTRIVRVGGSRGEQISGTDTSDTGGRFSFTELEASEYVLEALVGDEVVASASLILSAGAMEFNEVSLAQDLEMARSFQDLGTLMEPGMEVSVIDVTGNEIVGDVVEVSASALILSADGTRREFRESDVLRVTRPPHGMSRVVGGLIGAGAGFGGFLAVISVCAANIGTCDYGVYGAVAPMVGGGAAVGAMLTGRTDE